MEELPSSANPPLKEHERIQVRMSRVVRCDPRFAEDMWLFQRGFILRIQEFSSFAHKAFIFLYFPCSQKMTWIKCGLFIICIPIFYYFIIWIFYVISKVLGFIEKIHQFFKKLPCIFFQLFSKNNLPQCKESQKKHNNSHFKK